MPTEKKPVDVTTPVPAGTFGKPTPATLENSTTMKVILESQKKWRIGGIICGLVSTSGFAVAGAFMQSPPVFAVGLGVGVLGGIGGAVCALCSGAEVDENALQRIANNVATLLDKRPKA